MQTECWLAVRLRLVAVESSHRHESLLVLYAELVPREGVPGLHGDLIQPAQPTLGSHFQHGVGYVGGRIYDRALPVVHRYLHRSGGRVVAVGGIGFVGYFQVVVGRFCGRA
jgi:hypothetical protein